ENVGRSTGQLYRVNTLGAALGSAGCIALFPWIGMHAVIWLAVALNLMTAAGAIALFLHRRRTREIEIPWPQSPTGHSPRLRRPGAIALAFASGFISLSYEIFLFRLASVPSGPTSPRFAP